MVRIYKKMCPNNFITTMQIFVYVDVKIDELKIV